MADTKPGADELRIRSLLKQRGVGPDAQPPAAPPVPEQRPRDWLDDILDSDPAPAPVKQPAEPAPAPSWWQRSTPAEPPPDADPDDTDQDDEADPDPDPAPRRRPATPRAARYTPPQSLLDAHANIPPRLRWLAYHATAACAGWRLGLVDWATHTAAWYAAGHWTSGSAFVLYGLGACTVALYRRTRAWVWPVAWAAAIPASSITVGVLLYGTGA